MLTSLRLSRTRRLKRFLGARARLPPGRNVDRIQEHFDLDDEQLRGEACEGGCVLFVLFCCSVCWEGPRRAQGRLSDKDVQRLMQNLKDDAQPFQKSFAKALKKSTIRKTSQENDATALTDTFAKQANTALETFKHQQKADQEVDRAGAYRGADRSVGL